MVEFVKSYVTVQQPYDVELVDTFGGATYCELDYNKEGRNQDLFAVALKESCPEVRVPAVHWGSTSRKVLVTEWINGKQLASILWHTSILDLGFCYATLCGSGWISILAR